VYFGILKEDVLAKTDISGLFEMGLCKIVVLMIGLILSVYLLL